MGKEESWEMVYGKQNKKKSREKGEIGVSKEGTLGFLYGQFFVILLICLWKMAEKVLYEFF